MTTALLSAHVVPDFLFGYNECFERVKIRESKIIFPLHFGFIEDVSR